MFGFDALAAFTHHCETAFDRVRKGEVRATRDLVSAILNARDHMRALAEGGRDRRRGRGAAGRAAPRPGIGAGGARPRAGARPARWRIDFALPQDRLRQRGQSAGAAGGAARARRLPRARLHRGRAADRRRWSRPSAIWPGRVELATAAPRSAIEDVFIFVMDDMRLEITALDAAETPAAAEPRGRRDCRPRRRTASPPRARTAPRPARRASPSRACACPPSGWTS